MPNLLYQRDIISIMDLTREDMLLVLSTAAQIKEKTPENILANHIIATCFYEASTRTRLSFEAASYRLGAKIIGFSDAENSSHKKGESLSDTIRVISEYADALILRHPLEGSALLAAEVSDKPVINAGDGSHQHPTQTLLDLYSIQACQNRLDTLNIALVGDLKHGRTTHSLALACTLFDIRLFFISPDGLNMPEYICDQLKTAGLKFSFHEHIDDVMDRLDIIYMTRLQKERLSSNSIIVDPCILTPESLKKAKPNMKILHPLPRNHELDPALDDSPHAYYFQQAANGLFVRQALLALLLRESL